MSKHEEKARVLVVIPTLGEREELLRRTLESIKLQAPIKYDTVMVFPLKNKAIKTLAKEYGAEMVDDPGSLSSAVNAGIAMAKSNHEFISWIGDDDLLKKNSFKTAIKALDDNPDGVLAYGYCDYIDEDDRILFTNKAGRLAPWIMRWGPNLVPLPGMLFVKKALNKVGIFDEKNKYCMDLEMLLRLRSHGKFINTNFALAAFRWHSTSTTVSNRGKVLKETEEVKRRYLPAYLRPFSPLWDYPVRIATRIAAHRVTALAKRKAV
jgi:GT2 family glycosyltransferase